MNHSCRRLLVEWYDDTSLHTIYFSWKICTWNKMFSYVYILYLWCVAMSIAIYMVLCIYSISVSMNKNQNHPLFTQIKWKICNIYMYLCAEEKFYVCRKRFSFFFHSITFFSYLENYMGFSFIIFFSKNGSQEL